MIKQNEHDLKILAGKGRQKEKKISNRGLGVAQERVNMGATRGE